MFLIITYDISETTRRNKISNLLSSYGFRVNYSVFEFNISKFKYQIMINELQKISKKEDNIRIYIQTKETIRKSFILNSKNRPFEFDDGYI